MSETVHQMKKGQLRAIVSGLDAHPIEPDVLKCCAQSLKEELPGAMYDAVICKRVLCNIPPHEQPSVVRAMRDLTRAGGITIICEPHAPAHTRLSSARVQGGLRSLQRPSHNYPVGLTVLARLLGEHAASEPIGHDYYVWTRLILPLIKGSDVPYAAHSLRAAYGSCGHGLDPVHQAVYATKLGP